MNDFSKFKRFNFDDDDDSDHYVTDDARYRSPDVRPTKSGSSLNNSSSVSTSSNYTPSNKDFSFSPRDRSSVFYYNPADLASSPSACEATLLTDIPIPPLNETLRRISIGRNYVLTQYKSLKDKITLLEGALLRHDGNAVIAVLIFMKGSLKRDIFNKELMKRSIAIDHYCAYLRDAGEIDELHEILSALGRTEEAAMLKYRQCLSSTSSSSPEIRIDGLRDCVKQNFISEKNLPFEENAIAEQISLLQRQCKIEEKDNAAEKCGEFLLKSYPRKSTLLHQSAITTLYYSCFYHWNDPTELFSSPNSLCMEHHINEKQFCYSAVAALCRMRNWKELEKLFMISNKSKKFSSPIGFEKVVDALSVNRAPVEILEKYCSEVKEKDKRIKIGTKLGCHKSVIDTLVDLRDREKLKAYSEKIPESNSNLHQYLNEKMNSKNIKWKKSRAGS